MDPWQVGLTAAIALFAAASATASWLFYWWTRRQRSPKPILTWASIMRFFERDEEEQRPCFRVTLELTNPGEVPIHVLSMSAMVRDLGMVGTFGGEVWTRACAIPPHGVASLDKDIWLYDAQEEEAFPEGEQRAFEIDLEYVSGGRKKLATFGEVVGVARKEDGRWSSRALYKYWKRPTTPTPKKR